MQKILWIALAGAFGNIARFGLSGFVQRAYGAGFPMGTLAVNVLGCFLFGAIWSLAETRVGISAEVRTVVLIGFMGAFTTFSSFAFETAQMVRDSQWLFAFGNILVQNLVGIGCLFLGLSAGRML